MSILHLIRPDLLQNKQDAPKADGSLHRLHANELPWTAVSLDSIHFNVYPDTQAQRCLKEQLAASYQVNENQIVLTRGSDDAIDLVTRLFLKAGFDAFMQFPPTFSMYEFYIRLQQAQMIECPLDMSNNFTLSIDKIQRYWQANCKIIMLCRPNNPTAHLIDLELIASVCKHYTNQSVIVVDEAYIEFSNAQSATTLIPQFENLVVLRTLSKAYGLAGLRLGSIIAQSHLIEAFKSIIAPYSISSAVIELARRALIQEDWFTSAVARIQKARSELISALELCPVIEKIYPTQANFILIKTSYAQELTACFAAQSIAIRDFPPTSVLHQHLRITVGNNLQNQILMATLSSFSQP